MMASVEWPKLSYQDNGESCTMKENKYDDLLFFQKYSQMERSKSGLAGAGEWHELKNLLPDFSMKTVLDLGCGYGWHCKYAATHGAAYVLGTDISQKMLETAQKHNPGPFIEYRRAAMENLDFPADSFDVVLSSLAFHYVKDFEPLVQNISRWLKPSGAFVFSVEHPVFTAYGSQDWYYDENGDLLHFPVDNYYLDTLLRNGFLLLRVVEPQPPESMMELPGMKDELRRPMMLLVSAEKAG